MLLFLLNYEKYFYVYKSWITRISKKITSSYSLTGNDEIKTKMDQTIHDALNYDIENKIINRSLMNKNLKFILKCFMKNKSQFLHLFENELHGNSKSNQIKLYDKFIQSIGDVVLIAINKFKQKIGKIIVYINYIIRHR